MTDLEDCSREDLIEIVEHLQDDLREYKQYVGQQQARMNRRIAILEDENERLTERVAELEAQVDPDPHSKAYDDMSRGERIRKIRETLVEEAQRRHTGKAKMSYKDVLLLFDNHPSDGYAYKLMELAAKEGGFEYTDSNGKVVRVNTDAVKDESLFHTVNNSTSEEAA